jgi:hypothetical protein
LFLNGLPENFLKLISIDGSSELQSGLRKLLKSGTLLKATVLESFPEKNRAIIKISNKRIIVETQQTLTPGNSFSARVQKTSIDSLLEIKILTSPPLSTPSIFEDKTHISGNNLSKSGVSQVTDKKFIQDPYNPDSNLQVNKSIGLFKIKALLPIKESFGEMIHKLNILINSTSIVKNKGINNSLIQQLAKTLDLFQAESLSRNLPVQDHAQLKKQVDLSGINYEAKVTDFLQGEKRNKIPLNINTDLKGQLLNILKIVESRIAEQNILPDQKRQLMQIINIVSRAVDNIELHQLTNQYSRNEGQPLLLQIPDPFSPGKSINIYITNTDENESGKGGKDFNEIIFVFLLDLSKLGNLRVDAKVKKESITIKLEVESQNISKFIKENLKEISSRLEEIGFQVNVSCHVVTKVENNFEAQLNQLLVNDSKRLVDLTT